MDAAEHLDVRARARIGTTLNGKYRIDAVLGVGGMAVVYAATHRNNAEFAIKLLHPAFSAREDVRARFLREGYAANSVKHPGVVHIVDDDITEDGSAFIVMELLRGISVEDLTEKAGGRLPVSPAVGIVDQLLDVLAAAHAHGVIHRDIKPANLFLTYDGMVKVVDFGIARARALASQASANATTSGTLLGTPAYMAPEQALGRTSEVSEQTDLWSAGATLFTLITGQTVHVGDNVQHLLVLAASSRARLLASVVPDVPPAIASVVDRALAYPKHERWPSAEVMRDALRQAHCEAFGAPPVALPLLPLLAACGVSPSVIPPPPSTPAHSSTPSSPPSSGPRIAVPSPAPAHFPASSIRTPGMATTPLPITRTPPPMSAPRTSERAVGALAQSRWNRVGASTRAAAFVLSGAVALAVLAGGWIVVRGTASRRPTLPERTSAASVSAVAAPSGSLAPGAPVAFAGSSAAARSGAPPLEAPQAPDSGALDAALSTSSDVNENAGSWPLRRVPILNQRGGAGPGKPAQPPRATGQPSLPPPRPTNPFDERK
jgi:serine/threonine-protein kinase